MKTSISSILLFILVLIMSSMACDENNNQAFDSDFETVSIHRWGGGIGYCGKPGDVLSGTITITGDTAVYEGLGAVESESGCDSWISDSYCLVQQPFGPITLTPEELMELKMLVAEVPLKVCIPNLSWQCDDCLGTKITVDDVDATPYCCGYLNEAYSASFKALEEFMHDLAGLRI